MNRNLNFTIWELSKLILGQELISNEKFINKEVVELIDMYNFFFIITPCDKVWTIQILNFNKWQLQARFCNTKWFQLKRSWIPKLNNSSRSTTFILVISSSDKLLVHIVHKSTYLSYSFINYVRDLWICDQCILPLCRIKKWPK